jgi:hypothetical protein
MHGDDDQIVSIEFSVKRSAKLIKNAKPQIWKGGSHGIWSRSSRHRRSSLRVRQESTLRR